MFSPELCECSTEFKNTCDLQMAKEAYESCLKKSGCSLVRDVVDERLIKCIIDKTGKVIHIDRDVNPITAGPDLGRFLETLKKEP